MRNKNLSGPRGGDSHRSRLSSNFWLKMRRQTPRVPGACALSELRAAFPPVWAPHGTGRRGGKEVPETFPAGRAQRVQPAPAAAIFAAGPGAPGPAGLAERTEPGPRPWLSPRCEAGSGARPRPAPPGAARPGGAESGRGAPDVRWRRGAAGGHVAEPRASPFKGSLWFARAQWSGSAGPSGRLPNPARRALGLRRGCLRGLPGCGAAGRGGRARRSPRNPGGRAGLLRSGEGAAGPGAAALGRRACGCEQPAAARRTGRGAARLGVARRPHTMALAEVVVCAVGRVVTLPAVEITAQATALLVLVMLSAAAEDNGWGSPLCSGARGPRAARTPAGWGRTKPWAWLLEACERGSGSATFRPKDLN